MEKNSPIRAVLLYALVGTPLAVLVFLLATKFFVAWDGHAVGMRALASDDPSWYRVLIVADDGEEHIVDWPAGAAEGKGIETMGVLAPPPSIPDEAPHTAKSRYSLHFLVDQPDSGHAIVPTTTPSALALALLLWLMGLMLRNMVVSGSPFSFESRPTKLPEQLPTAGQVKQNKAARSKYGPPPPKRGKGKGRRR